MIRPIEMQMLLPQTESVGTEKHFENKQIVNENNFAANEVKKEVKHNSETVIQKDANQFAQYQYDAKEESNGEYHNFRRKQRKRKKEEAEDAKNSSKEKEELIQPRINIQI